MSQIADIQALVKEVEEARELLARKAEIEKDLAREQKRLDRIRAEHAAEEAGLENTRAVHQKARDNFEHERKRYEIDLHEHAAQCAATKAENERVNTAEMKTLDADVESFRARVDTEKRALAVDIEDLKGLRDTLKAEIKDFRARIDALGK